MVRCQIALSMQLAFDHNQIVDATLEYIRNKIQYESFPLFELLLYILIEKLPISMEKYTTYQQEWIASVHKK